MALKIFTLRPEQMRVLSVAMKEADENRLVDHCYEEFPELCEELGEPEVERLVRFAIAMAAENGYESYSDVMIFAELVVGYGEDFAETQPWARLIWEANLPPGRKLAVLAAAASDEKIRALTEDPDA